MSRHLLLTTSLALLYLTVQLAALAVTALLWSGAS